ncbi:hypothetical protein [Streptomyces sp. NPDC058620]|uniref:hypothetical protein n=1 Tax=Streptomyces sp. NPDC058620 TaxID=3346560 RepID=UPI0036551EC8
METEADGITADMVITELDRRDVPLVRFSSADIGEDLGIRWWSLRDGVGYTPKVAKAGHPPKSVLESVQNQDSIWVR